jgi:hypothetical protein
MSHCPHILIHHITVIYIRIFLSNTHYYLKEKINFHSTSYLFTSLFNFFTKVQISNLIVLEISTLSFICLLKFYNNKFLADVFNWVVKRVNGGAIREFKDYRKPRRKLGSTYITLEAITKTAIRIQKQKVQSQ